MKYIFTVLYFLTFYQGRQVALLKNEEIIAT